MVKVYDRMKMFFFTSLRSLLCLFLLFSSSSTAPEYVTFTSQSPDKAYTIEGQNALIDWEFTIGQKMSRYFRGVVYYVKNHTEWTVVGIDNNRTGVRSLQAHYRGRFSVDETGKLKIVNCTPSDTTTYKIVVRFSVIDDVERTVHLTVLVPPNITSSPKSSTTVVAGKLLQLHCTASGYPLPIVVLTRGDATLAMGSNGSVSWAAHSVSTVDRGNYKCWAWNHEKTKSDERTFKVYVKSTQLPIGGPPKILRRPQNKTVRIGEHFVLECNATGEPALQFRWLKNGVEMQGNHSSPILEIKAANKQSDGIYVCEAKNKFGTRNVTFVIKVSQDAQGIEENLSNPCMARGALVTLIVLSSVGSVAITILVAMAIYICRRRPPTCLECKKRSIEGDRDEGESTHDNQKQEAFVNDTLPGTAEQL